MLVSLIIQPDPLIGSRLANLNRGKFLTRKLDSENRPLVSLNGTIEVLKAFSPWVNVLKMLDFGFLVQSSLEETQELIISFSSEVKFMVSWHQESCIMLADLGTWIEILTKSKNQLPFLKEVFLILQDLGLRELFKDYSITFEDEIILFNKL